MFPACQASDYLRPDKKGRCSAVNISKCYQNIDINLDDSSVDNLVVMQDEAGCGTQFTKKRGCKVTPGSDSADSSAENIDSKVPNDNQGDIVLIFMFIMFIIALYVFVIEPMMDDTPNETPEVYYSY